MQVRDIPVVRVTQSSAQTITNGMHTQLLFDTETFDRYGMHNTSSNTGRLTAVVAGIYRVDAQVSWASGTTGFRHHRIRLNSATDIASDWRSPVGSDAAFLSILYPATVGQWFDVVVAHTQGTDLDTDENITAFSAQWVAPLQ